MKRTQLTPYICIVLFSLFLSLLFIPLNIIQTIDWWFMDQMAISLRETSKPHPKVKIILIDDISVNQLSPILGRYPWPRGIYAPIIDFLNKGNAKEIYFDILFSEFEESTNSHQEFSSMLANHDNVHLVAILTNDFKEPQNPPDNILKSSLTFPIHKNLRLENYERLYFPIPELSASAATIPISTIVPDFDGRYRKLPLIHKYNDFHLNSLPLSYIQKHDKIKAISSFQIKSENYLIPILKSGEMLINWYPRGIDKYSFSGILASWQSIQNNRPPLVDPKVFENSIVLIGSSAVGLHDLKSTPIHSHLAGVEIQASALSNIFNDEVLKLTPKWFQILLLIFIICVTPYYLIQVPNLKRYVYLLMIPFTLTVTMTTLFSHANYVLNLALPLTGFWISYLIAIGYNSILEFLEKKKVKQTFSMYVSPKILREITQNYQDIKPEVGKKKEVTILFSDIRSFTSLTESHPVEIIIKLLNDYFDAMIETIQKNDGTVDKMIGDAIMAFWNAPIDIENHAEKAVRTAQQMQERLKDLNHYWGTHSLPTLESGIGINTGACIVGNIGSSRRVNYTLIGDAVNATARLEGLCKNYSDNILISENTFKKIHHQLPCNFIDNVLVKGKSNPIKIYSPR